MIEDGSHLQFSNLIGGRKLALAPMAGVTDLAFRAICRKHGAEITYTEMVSTKGLYYNDAKSKKILRILADDYPCGAQIFGSDPQTMGLAAKSAIEISGAPFLDINMGCPTGKIISSGDGAALMRTPELAAEVISAVVSNSPVPVTVKIRKGWDSGSVNCVQIAQIAEREGAAAICIHGRTRSQLYSGRADWDSIRDVKQAVGIPVIANGDVASGEDAVRILRYTKADMVMIGRATFGNPWIFREAAAALSGTPTPARPTIDEICDTASEHFELALEDKGEHIACLESRKHFAWYLKGVRYAAYYKEKISKITTADEFFKIVKGVRRDLK